MKKIILTFFAMFLFLFVHAQQTQPYAKAYGDKSDPAIIFLHGGPGYNAVSFEFTTARPLAEQGYYVIVWDQPGNGRSKSVKADFTFEASHQAINRLYDQFGLQQAVLMGHSFGGTLAVKYARLYPEKVKKLVLVSTPVAYPKVFETILERCRTIYTAKNETAQLRYIDMLEAMDPASLSYSAYTFAHAMNCGLYQPSEPTDEAKVLYSQLMQGEQAAYLNKMEKSPVSGFHASESYTSLDLSQDLQALKSLKIPVKALYGNEDGLFDSLHIQKMSKLIGEASTITIEGASHNIFIDQQTLFLDQAMN